jgi:hypothetical protein
MAHGSNCIQMDCLEKGGEVSRAKPHDHGAHCGFLPLHARRPKKRRLEPQSPMHVIAHQPLNSVVKHMLFA